MAGEEDEVSDMKLFKSEKSSILQVSALFYIPKIAYIGKRHSTFDELFALFHITDHDTGEYVQVGRSKIYTTQARLQFQVSYKFGGKQDLVIQLLGKRPMLHFLENMKETKHLCLITCSIGKLIKSGKKWLEPAMVMNSSFEGESIGYAVKLKASQPYSDKEQIQFQIGAELPDLTIDPENPIRLFCNFYKLNKDASRFDAIGKSDAVEGSNSPVWKPVALPSRPFIDSVSGKSSQLQITIMSIGSDAETSGLEKLKSENVHFVAETLAINVDIAKQMRGTSIDTELYSDGTLCGMLDVTPTIIYPKSFVDYLHDGLEMNFCVAIDFSTNNGELSDPNCYHQYNENNTNEYVAAIKDVGNVIQDYDSDKKFPVFGFGAEMDDGTLLNEFNCTFNDAKPLVDGVDGIIEAYRGALEKVTLSGPSLIAPIIRMASRLADAAKDEDNGHYFVLMILTAGNVKDLEEATRAVIEVSHLPISIVIVGIGDNNCDELNEVGRKGNLLNMDGHYCARDIVSFVKYVNTAGMSEQMREMYSVGFTADVMFEIPDHVLAYKDMSRDQATPAAEGYDQD